jgi:membrane protein implicated in regulation of membrane protease activity
MISVSPRKAPLKRMTGEGIVSETVYPGIEWRVEFRASYWTARSNCSTAFEPGAFVRIVEIDTENLLLLIEPI